MRQVRLRTILVAIALLSAPLARWANRWRSEAQIGAALDELIRDSTTSPAMRSHGRVRDAYGRADRVDLPAVPSSAVGNFGEEQAR